MKIKLQELEKQILFYCDEHKIDKIIISSGLSASLISLYTFKKSDPVLLSNNAVENIFHIGILGTINIYVCATINFTDMNIYDINMNKLFEIIDINIFEII